MSVKIFMMHAPLVNLVNVFWVNFHTLFHLFTLMGEKMFTIIKRSSFQKLWLNLLQLCFGRFAHIKSQKKKEKLMLWSLKLKNLTWNTISTSWLGRELLLQGKAKYNWPPVFDITNIISFFTEQATLIRRSIVLSLPLQSVSCITNSYIDVFFLFQMVLKNYTMFQCYKTFFVVFNGVPK
jgi:hypothetical protein